MHLAVALALEHRRSTCLARSGEAEPGVGASHQGLGASQLESSGPRRVLWAQPEGGWGWCGNDFHRNGLTRRVLQLCCGVCLSTRELER